MAAKFLMQINNATLFAIGAHPHLRKTGLLVWSFVPVSLFYFKRQISQTY
jgi:hypothetical protein